MKRSVITRMTLTVLVSASFILLSVSLAQTDDGESMAYKLDMLKAYSLRECIVFQGGFEAAVEAWLSCLVMDTSVLEDLLTDTPNFDEELASIVSNHIDTVLDEAINTHECYVYDPQKDRLEECREDRTIDIDREMLRLVKEAIEHDKAIKKSEAFIQCLRANHSDMVEPPPIDVYAKCSGMPLPEIPHPVATFDERIIGSLPTEAQGIVLARLIDLQVELATEVQTLEIDRDSP